MENQAAELKSTKTALYKVQHELEVAEMKNKQLERQQSRRFSVECFKDSPDDMSFYTGLPRYETFMGLYRFVDPGENGEK